MEHLHNNLEAVDLRLSVEQMHLLNDASALAGIHPYDMFTDDTQKHLFGGAAVQNGQ